MPQAALESGSIPGPLELGESPRDSWLTPGAPGRGPKSLGTDARHRWPAIPGPSLMGEVVGTAGHWAQA